MAELIDRIKQVDDPRDTKDKLYDLADVKAAATEVIEIPCGWLAVLVEDAQVSFVVLSFCMGDEPILCERVFHGTGYSGALRELRHSFWGEPDNSGYIYYPNARLITAAFRELQRWFDCD